ncbi:MAG: phosphoglycerate dehydrogenase [Phycisphaerales bacterium]|nr:phosphoglycerate dehydrogenase [Phycisphaerales bacterium]
MSDTVLLLESVHEGADEVLATGDLMVKRISGAMDEAALIAALDGVAVLGIRSKTHITDTVLEAATSLQAIGCFCIGTNQVDLDAAARRGIAVFNSPFSNTRSVAELTLAEIIGLHRRMCDRSRELHEGTWRKSARGAHEVRGRTLGIVGYGHIGSQISVLAESLGMQVIYHDIEPKMPLGNARAVDSLDQVLQSSDVVTLHVPATPATANLIGQRELALMQPHAMLINNARGSVVDLDALAQALQEGRLGGAAIDVYPSEPSAGEASFECPLAGLPNVILTPHVGGSTIEAQAIIAREVAAKIVRFRTRGTTMSAVNVPSVDLPSRNPDHLRVLHFHRNVPGVLSALHRVIADTGANIHAEYLQSLGDISYVILDIDRVDTASLTRAIEGLDETIRLQLLS